MMNSAVTIGSSEHKDRFCQFFVDTHRAFDPDEMAWPELDDDSLKRLRSLPFWDEAVDTENVTSSVVQAATAIETDPLIRDAIALQGYEEGRHARILRRLTRIYGIDIPEPGPPATSANKEWDFMYAGYGETFDSFFAFGLFSLGRDSGFFPEKLLDIFEPVMQEEARHILFFVNWIAYRKAQLPLWRRPAFSLRCWAIIVLQVISRIKTARQLGKQADSANFTMTAHQQFAESPSLRAFLMLCLKENDRRFSRYDATLLRPRLVPRFARMVVKLLPRGRADK